MNTKLLGTSSELLKVFEEQESEVRSYCRSFPTVFERAKDYRMWDVDGKAYIDFFAGAGSLNYGHNNDRIKARLLGYLQEDGIVHSLDMATVAKERLLRKLRGTILEPRGLNYKVMFPGPTGTNAVESALKLARKATGRDTVIGFTNAFHGMTLGSLAVTGNKFKREGAGVPLHHTVSMPYCSYHGEEADTIAYIERYLEDGGSGVALPAAIIMETVQGEGGINAASHRWIRKIAELCKSKDILLIIDDVQAGCGRTGPFFSFEPAGIEPDIVCLSKSIGGYGLPLALTLFKPELDIWGPGEHNGTFRGNNLGFVAAEEALRYWDDPQFEREVVRKGEIVRHALEEIRATFPNAETDVRGRGLMRGIAFAEPGLAERICGECFRRGLIMETSGADSEVAKVMPPLTIDEEGLRAGLAILKESVRTVAEQRTR